MCGKMSTVNIKWRFVYEYASLLRPPAQLPADPVDRINLSPSRLRRRSDPDSIV
jgi:hypothetical protein